MGVREEVRTGILVGRPEGKNHLEDIGKYVKIILQWTFKKWDGGMDWTELAQDRNRWRALVNAVMDLPVSQNAGNFLTC